MKKYLSDVLQNTFRDWVDNAKCFFVLLMAGCGCGKTYFLVRVLLPYAIRKGKKVSIFVPRTALLKKYQMDILDMLVKERLKLEEVEKQVVIMTYQNLGKRLQQGLRCPMSDITIVEEASSFFDDIMFDETRMLVYLWLTSEGKSALNIWVSGTGKRIFKKLISDLGLRINESTTFSDKGMKLAVTSFCCYSNSYEEYDMENDYSWIDVQYMETVNPVELVSLHPKEKWVFYLESKKIQEEFYKALTEAGYKVAILNAENIDKEQTVVNSIVCLDKFYQQILLTTAVIESGNDFTERELKNQVVLRSIESPFIQMCNRRRRQSEDDIITLYILKRDKKYFEWCLEKVMEKLMLFLNEVFCQVDSLPDAIKVIMDTNIKQREDLFQFIEVDNRKMVKNELLLEELIYQKDFYTEMCKLLQEDEHAFIKRQLSWLKLEGTFDLDNYISVSIREDAKKEIVDKVKSMEEKKENYTFEEASDFVKSLIPLVEKVDKTVTKGGMALPKFKKFCQNQNLPCDWKSVKIKKVTYYSFTTWDKGEDIAEFKEDYEEQ